MSQQPPASPYYLVDKIIPAYRPHIIAGSSGAGKTTLTFQLARDMWDGKAWFGHPVQRDMKVGYIGTDRVSASYQHKFESMGLTSFPVHSFLDSKKYRPSEVREHIPRWLEIAYKMGDRPDLLILDPLSCFLPARIADYHANADTLVIMSQFCLEFRVTILGTYHAGKLKKEQGFMRPQDRILGTGALLAFSDTQLFLTDSTEIPKAPGYHLVTINPHDSPLEEFKLCRQADTGLFVPWVDADQYVKERKILNLVPNLPNMRGIGDVVEEAAEVLDCSTKTARRMLDTLETDGFIVRPKYGFIAQNKPS